MKKYFLIVLFNAIVISIFWVTIHFILIPITNNQKIITEQDFNNLIFSMVISIPAIFYTGKELWKIISFTTILCIITTFFIAKIDFYFIEENQEIKMRILAFFILFGTTAIPSVISHPIRRKLNDWL